MVAAMHMTIAVLKLRIGLMIAATALAGMAAAGWGDMSAWRAAMLALGVLGASGASGAFNHYYERDLDRRMRRTGSRPFASGTLRPGAKWPLVFLLLLAVSLLLSWIAAGGVAAAFVFLGAFTYGIVYTVWLKRRSVWNIVIGGLSGSFAVLAGAYAVTPDPAPMPLILAIVLFLWTPPHFWSLAGAKGDEYRAAGVPMLATVAPARVWTMVVLLHTLALVTISLVPPFIGAGWFYGVCAAAGGAFFAWRSILLWHAPSTKAAMANFGASLVQLALLLLGVFLDGLLRFPS